MAHQIETMAFAHEVPWHGLGVQVTADLSYDEMLVKAGLDWTVSLRPMHFTGNDGKSHEMPDRYALVRDSDDQPMSVAGTRYNPVQNKEALRFFDRFIQAGKARMETAGSLRDGKLVWGLANLGADFTLPGGDKVKGYLLLGSPHECGKSLLARTTAIRVVCANTFAAATAGSAKFEKRFSHVREFDADEAADLFDGARENMAEFAIEAAALKAMKLGREDVIKVLASVYQSNKEISLLLKDEKEWNPTMRVLMEAYETAPGADPGNGWGVLQAATYRSNHIAGTRADQRLNSAWLGSEAKRTADLMAGLRQLAA